MISKIVQIILLSVILGSLKVSAQQLNAENNIVIAAGSSQYPWVLNPQVAATTDGGYVVSWTNYNPATTNYESVINAQKFNDEGIATGQAVEINIIAPTFSPLATVTLEEGGFAIAYSAENDVVACFFNSEGQSNGEQVLATFSGNPKGQSFSLAPIGSGGVVASWISNNELVIQSFDALGNAITGEFQIGIQSSQASVMSALLQNEETIIVLSTPNNPFGQYVSANGELDGLPFLLSGLTAQFESITPIAGNNFALAGNRPGNCSLYVQIYNSQGNPFSNSECLNTNSGVNAISLSPNREGFLATWTIGNNEEVGWSAIFGRTFNNEAAQESPVVLVNSSSNLQNYFTVSSATLTTGYSVIAWTSGFRVQNSTIVVQWLNSTGYPVPPTAPPQPTPPRPNSGYLLSTVSIFLVVLTYIALSL